MGRGPPSAVWTREEGSLSRARGLAIGASLKFGIEDLKAEGSLFTVADSHVGWMEQARVGTPVPEDILTLCKTPAPDVW